MKAVLAVLGGALVAVVLFVVLQGQHNGDSGSSSQISTGSGGAGGPGHGSGGSGGSEHPDSTGTVDVSRRGTSGTERVDCSNIDSELKISARDGSVRWTAVPAAGVSVSPSSGFLDEGESQVIHVGGRYTGAQTFTVNVSAPSRAGSSGVPAEFTCA
ncbi:conserved exported hypothetical protein [Frankia canadensis]|uniref:Uncharacterized protein n=1 Tax=Frankia canadensis TaxID=1836972 RepID=A0A2I2KV56_9ACTN|nr:hypothetical protein [Frankia canadensis]SNQ49541.1 conserved exported hypothetical protein [Frankia canadensis]SOU56831.1 conserved exported hypothetical protein [Frankia canadensis]